MKPSSSNRVSEVKSLELPILTVSLLFKNCSVSVINFMRTTESGLKSEATPLKMSSIPVPEEILDNILLRLPLETISISRCVCKQWYTLLSNPSFVKNQYDFTVEKKKPNFILVDDFEGKYTINSINYDSLSAFESLGDSECEIDERDELGHPFDYLVSDVEILGVCNGLLCILICNIHKKEDEEIICFWNPRTAEYKRLPDPPNEFPCGVKIDEYNCSYHGFYHDYKADDYKLIRFVAISGDSTRLGVQVYSLQSNSWKNLPKYLPYQLPGLGRRPGVLVHGALHWLVVKKNFVRPSPRVILSADTRAKKFSHLALPEVSANEDLCIELGGLDGCLCLLVVAYGVRADFWVMQEHGIRQSWTKIFTTNQELMTKDVMFDYYRPICSLQNGDILLPHVDGFVLYNPKQEKAKLVAIDGLSGYSEVSEVESYTESLVSLGSRTYVGQDDFIEDVEDDSQESY